MNRERSLARLSAKYLAPQQELTLPKLNGARLVKRVQLARNLDRVGVVQSANVLLVKPLNQSRNRNLTYISQTARIQINRRPLCCVRATSREPELLL